MKLPAPFSIKCYNTIMKISAETIVRKIGIIGSGHTMNMILNWFFDVILYTSVVAWFGFWGGLAIMIPFSVIWNLFWIKIYDMTGQDWFGFESLKVGKEGAVENSPGWLKKIIQSSDWLATIFVVFYDPILATVYLRRIENAHKGLSKRDWTIFWTSTVLANVGWTAIVYGGVTAVKAIYFAIINL